MCDICSAIAAILDATPEQLESLHATALRLGQETSFSAAEAAEGMQKLIDAGLSLDEALGDAGRTVLEIVDGAKRATPADPSEMNDA